MIAPAAAPADAAEHTKLRVLFFSEAFWPQIGGIEVMTARLLPALAARGYEILVVTDRASDSAADHDALGGVPIRRLALRAGIHRRDVELLARTRQELAAIVRDFRPDLVHAIFIGPSIWFLPKLATVPMIVDCHGSWPEIEARPDGLFARIARGATWITACSQAALDDVYRYAPGVASAPATIMPYGLDATFPGEPPEPPPGPPVLVCTGRMVPEKGMDVAVAAMAHVLARVPDARLVIGGDGPERARLEREAAELGIAASVTFCGWISPERAHELVAQATAVLVPSRIEGFGIVALEAALMARPVVASAAGGLTEAVVDGSTGVLVPPGEPQALADAIVSLLDDPERARTLGHAGRRRALQDYTAAQYVDRWDAFYSRIGKNLHER
jgi:glycosyltransferase involved in cell wall biosynthesis